MDDSRYTEYKANQMILRDHLAVERTALANERTLLAYVRTMIGVIAIGGSLVKLFEEWQYITLGWLIMGSGFLVLIIGFNRYIRIESMLSRIVDDSELSTSDKLHQLLWTTLTKLHLAKIIQHHSR